MGLVNQIYFRHLNLPKRISEYFSSLFYSVTHSSNSFSLTQLFFRSYSSSFSFMPFLLLTLIDFRKSNIKLIVILLAINFINFFFSVYLWQLAPSLQKLLISFCLSFFYHWHLIYKCLTIYPISLQHQRWSVFITPIMD